MLTSITFLAVVISIIFDRKISLGSILMKYVVVGDIVIITVGLICYTVMRVNGVTPF